MHDSKGPMKMINKVLRVLYVICTCKLWRIQGNKFMNSLTSRPSEGLATSGATGWRCAATKCANIHTALLKSRSHGIGETWGGSAGGVEIPLALGGFWSGGDTIGGWEYVSPSVSQWVISSVEPCRYPHLQLYLALSRCGMSCVNHLYLHTIIYYKPEAQPLRYRSIAWCEQKKDNHSNMPDRFLLIECGAQHIYK